MSSTITRWALATIVATSMLSASALAEDAPDADTSALEDAGACLVKRQQAEKSDDQGASADGGATPMISMTDVQPILQPVSDYTGAFADRTTITGDWGGLRQKLRDSGIALDAALAQTYRAVASGGEKTHDGGYNALLDYGLTLDTAKLGLWPGGYFSVTAQSGWGKGLPVRDGSISPSDYLTVFPVPERPTTKLMEYYWIQGLSDSLGVMVGRVDPVAWDRNRFAFDARNQFMNGALDQQLLVGGLVSFSTYTVSAMLELDEHVAVLSGIFDPEVKAGDSTTPFDEMGYYAVVELSWDVADDLGGTARLLGIHETSDTTNFDNPRLVLDEILADIFDKKVRTKSGNSMVGVNFEQYIWKPDVTDDGRVGTRKLDWASSSLGFQEPGLGVFGRVAFLPDSRNPYSESVSMGLAGRGIIPGRPLDRMGIGGYTLQASDDLGGLVDFVLEDEWGGEAYYNLALAPSVQLTFDVQYIDGGVNGIDDALVFGLRLSTQF